MNIRIKCSPSLLACFRDCDFFYVQKQSRFLVVLSSLSILVMTVESCPWKITVRNSSAEWFYGIRMKRSDVCNDLLY